MTVAALLPSLAGCAATRKMVRYRDLRVDTEVTRSVFLEPTSRAPTVHVSVGNSSGVEADLQMPVVSLLARAGYRVVDGPEDATYVLQANVLQVTRRNLDEDEDVRDAIVEAAAAGVVAGAVVGAIGNEEAWVDEVLVGAGVLAYVADAAVQRPAYTMLSDVRITETVRDPSGTRRNVHETRIVSGASKVNLGWEEALPSLLDAVSRSVAGLFPAARPTGVAPGR